MRLGSKCAVPMTEADSPSGRPDIGGSGSPAPTTTRTGGVGGAEGTVAGSGASEAVATLPDFGRSAIAESGLATSFGDWDLADALAGPEADGSGALAAFASPAAVAARPEAIFAGGTEADGSGLAVALAEP